MKPNPLALICGLLLCIMLTLGLWPFHSPHNGVAWIRDGDGLRFSRHGTVISSRAIRLTDEPDTSEASLEVWLQPGYIWDFGTVLALYEPGNPFQFSIRQSQTDALLRIETRSDRGHIRTSNLGVNNAFHKTRPTFLTITAGRSGANVYVDGSLAASAPEFPLSAKTMAGELVLGDSPGQSDSWAGNILGLAFYRRELTAAQTRIHYATWQKAGRPLVAEGERINALYLFHERNGALVRDEERSGFNLYIPETYRVMEKIVLQPFWTEFEITTSYFAAAVKNVIGFIPFGFFIYAYLLTRFARQRAALVTVLLGTAVSFTIEILQAFLPTRDSGTTDIITNTIGAWIGVCGYRLLALMFPRFFSQATARDGAS